MPRRTFIDEHKCIGWETRDGLTVPITKMSDEHLMNAYRITGDEDLFREMVLRLFNTRILEIEI